MVDVHARHGRLRLRGDSVAFSWESYWNGVLSGLEESFTSEQTVGIIPVDQGLRFTAVPGAAGARSIRQVTLRLTNPDVVSVVLKAVEAIAANPQRRPLKLFLCPASGSKQGCVFFTDVVAPLLAAAKLTYTCEETTGPHHITHAVQNMDLSAVGGIVVTAPVDCRLDCRLWQRHALTCVTATGDWG